MPEITDQVDKLFGLGSQLVNMDAQQAFARLMPVLQQMAQIAATYAPQPPLDPASQVYKETSLAETQRKTMRDAKELQIMEEKADTDALLRVKDQQIRVAMDAADNLTDERIKTAELSHDADVLKHEQEKTAITALKEAQSTLGGLNGQY